MKISFISIIIYIIKRFVKMLRKEIKNKSFSGITGSYGNVKC